MSIDPLEESKTGYKQQSLTTNTAISKKGLKKNYVADEMKLVTNNTIIYITPSQIIDEFLNSCKVLVPQISILAILANGLLFIPLIPFIKFKLGKKIVMYEIYIS